MGWVGKDGGDGLQKLAMEGRLGRDAGFSDAYAGEED